MTLVDISCRTVPIKEDSREQRKSSGKRKQAIRHGGRGRENADPQRSFNSSLSRSEKTEVFQSGSRTLLDRSDVLGLIHAKS